MDGMTVAARRHRVARAAKMLSTPRWMVVHLFVVALAVTMILLGRWQLGVSNRKHFDLQNFGYSLQWWAFTACALLAWVRIMRDRLHDSDELTVPSSGGEIVRRGDTAPTTGPAMLVRPAADPVAAAVMYRGYVLPASSAAPVRSHGDSYHDSYNDYLWQLSLADSAEKRREQRVDRAGRVDAAAAPRADGEPL